MESNYSRWLKRIRDTQTEEIDCSACLDQIPQYVEFELEGSDPGKHLPLVQQHLGQCGVCFEEYQLLHELARLEWEGRLPSNEDLVDRLKKPPRLPEDE